MVITSEAQARRRASIVAAISAELTRQGASDLDIEALADAVETAIAAHLPISEGRHPDELNATNDD